MQLVLFAIITAAVAALAFGILDIAFSEERRVKRRLRDLTDYEQAQAREIEPLLRPFFERVIHPFVGFIGGKLRLAAPGGYRARVRERLAKAGNPRGIDVDRFLIAKTATALGMLFFVGIFAAGTDIAIGRIIVLALIAVPLAFFVPDLWLRGKVSDRAYAIRRALPDMLDMLTISVEAGLGFDAAVSKLVKNSSGPLAMDFGRMLQEVQSGASRSDALKSMAARTNVPELNAFITSMVQADVFGISISQVLRVQAHEMRSKRRQFAEEQAQKAPVKIVFPLIFCILPATIIVIMGPAVIQIGRLFGLIS